MKAWTRKTSLEGVGSIKLRDQRFLQVTTGEVREQVCSRARLSDLGVRALSRVYLLFTKAVRGGIPLPLTEGLYFITSYSWSGDGSKLYYAEIEPYPNAYFASTVS
jgi:hypothetical protein